MIVLLFLGFPRLGRESTVEPPGDPSFGEARAGNLSELLLSDCGLAPPGGFVALGIDFLFEPA